MVFSHRTKTLSILLIMALALTGCYPTGENPQLVADNNENPEKVLEQISNIASENEHLNIDSSPLESYPQELPEINVSVMEWDTKTLDELFISRYENIEHTEYPCDFFTNENYHLYDSTDESAYRLVYEPGRLSSSKREKLAVYGYGTMAGALDTYCFSDFFDDDHIDNLSESQAVDMVRTQLVSLGMTNLSEPSIYSITADKANEYFEYHKFRGYGYEYLEWSCDDEVYIIRFPLEYDGIPLTTDASFDMVAGGHGSYFVGSRITAIVTKDEVLSLDCGNIFSPTYSIGESVAINCSAQNALKTAVEYYDSTILGNSDIEIKTPELVYVPFEQHDEKNFTLVPMWKIDASIKSNDEDIMGKYNFLFVEVENGNLVIW